MSTRKNTARRSGKSNFPLFVVILLLVAAIFIGAKKIDWATARTHKNVSGGYAISFPLNASLHVNKVKVEGKNEYRPVENVTEIDIPGKAKPYILISYSDNMEEQTVDDYLANTSECEAMEENPGEVVYIDGVKAMLYKNIQCNTDGETRIYVVRGVRGYSITFNEKNVDEKYLQMVLKNLKFI